MVVRDRSQGAWHSIMNRLRSIFFEEMTLQWPESEVAGPYRFWADHQNFHTPGGMLRTSELNQVRPAHR